MLALWGGLNSVIEKDDEVLCISNGIFGAEIALMAKKMGAKVTELTFPPTKKVDNKKIIETIGQLHPKLVTIVHCETPTGILNDLSGIGKETHKHGGLFLVDFVSSAGGVPLNVDEEEIDLGLLGTQKVLSTYADLCMVSISENAWKRIEKVAYHGYDALLPFKNAVETKYFPYTHNWNSICSLKVATEMLLQEGLENSWERHKKCAEFCRKKVQEMGLELYPEAIEDNSNTVTAVTGFTTFSDWKTIDTELRKFGIILGGSYGEFAGKVFRIGHMGSQANMELLQDAIEKLEQVVKSLKSTK